MRRSWPVVFLVGCAATPLAAQTVVPWTRAAVVQAALRRSALLAAARADTLAAHAEIVTARSLPDPTLSASYSRDEPRYHVTAEMPVDALWLRGLRINAGETSAVAARYRQQYQVAAVTLDADTLYTRAVAGAAHARLSARDAHDADSLRRMTAARRDAGDASDLDVELATLAAGQLANVAAADSMSAATVVLRLQSLIGITDDHQTIEPSDTLMVSAGSSVAVPDDTMPLLVAGQVAELQAATLDLRVQQRSWFTGPSLMIGFDTGDPSREERGLLPTFGVTLPLPIFNRNRGGIAMATAQRDRVRAALGQAETDNRVELAVARGTLAAASARLVRDSDLVRRADRVSSMSLTAYREGAAPLTSVLEAERSARDVQGSYIDDVASVLIAQSTLRLLTVAAAGVTP